MRGTKVMRGADFNSDHELLLSNIQIKFKVIGREKHRTARYNLEKLKNNDIRENFKIRTENRFEALLQEENDQEILWSKGRDIIKEEAGMVVGKERKIKQQWITQEILDLCNETREAKKRKNISPTQENIANHRSLRTEVKQKCREAKEKWIDAQCRTCKDSFKRGQTKQLFTSIKNITREWKHITSVVRNENNEKTSEIEQVQKIWKTHF